MGGAYKKLKYFKGYWDWMILRTRDCRWHTKLLKFCLEWLANYTP